VEISATIWPSRTWWLKTVQATSRSIGYGASLVSTSSASNMGAFSTNVHGLPPASRSTTSTRPGMGSSLTHRVAVTSTKAWPGPVIKCLPPHRRRCFRRRTSLPVNQPDRASSWPADRRHVCRVSADPPTWARSHDRSGDALATVYPGSGPGTPASPRRPRRWR